MTTGSGSEKSNPIRFLRVDCAQIDLPVVIRADLEPNWNMILIFFMYYEFTLTLTVLTCQRSLIRKSSGISRSRIDSPWRGPNWVRALMPSSHFTITPKPWPGSVSLSSKVKGKLNLAKDFDRSTWLKWIGLLSFLETKINDHVSSLALIINPTFGHILVTLSFSARSGKVNNGIGNDFLGFQHWTLALVVPIAYVTNLF